MDRPPTISPGNPTFYDLGGYRRVYHYHIRKTAGTSLNASFWALGGLDLLTFDREPRLVRNGLAFARGSPVRISEGDYFYANSHHPAHVLELPAATFTITILRNPRDRLLSLYRYLVWARDDPEARSQDPHWKGARFQAKRWLGQSFDDFLDNIPKTHLLAQLYMFSDSLNVNEAIDRIASCSRVLFTEYFSRDLKRLGRRLELPLVERHERRYARDIETQLTDSEEDRIADVLHDEFTLVEAVRSMRQSEG